MKILTAFLTVVLWSAANAQTPTSSKSAKTDTKSAKQGKGGKGTTPSPVTLTPPPANVPAPPTPTPPTPVTSSPTKVSSSGMRLVGSGVCVDISGEEYSRVVGLLPVGSTYQNCDVWCSQDPGSSLIGIVTETTSTDFECACLYSDGAVPVPHPDLKNPTWTSSFDGTATGPIVSAKPEIGNPQCYAYLLTDETSTPSATLPPIMNPLTMQPTKAPSMQPTKNPTTSPTTQPTKAPTVQPTKNPTASPTSQPTKNPTTSPTSQPTKAPTVQPTKNPIISPSTQPTKAPTGQPTKNPIISPSTQPTKAPTMQPTKNPTVSPSSQPTMNPTTSPTGQPTKASAGSNSPTTSAPVTSSPTPPGFVPPVPECTDANPCPGDEVCTGGVCHGGGGLRFTLTWTGTTDFDLKVKTPNGDEISFRDRYDLTTQGQLDKDSGFRDNAGFKNPHVENIFFPNPVAITPGRYTAGVEYSTDAKTEWKLEIFDTNGHLVQVVKGSDSLENAAHIDIGTASPNSTPNPTDAPTAYPTIAGYNPPAPECSTQPDCGPPFLVCTAGKCHMGGQLRFTLTWSGSTVYYLYVFMPDGTVVDPTNKYDSNGNKVMDIDTADGSFQAPHIQSIAWNSLLGSSAPAGRYCANVKVQHCGKEVDWTLQVFDNTGSLYDVIQSNVDLKTIGCIDVV